MNKEYGVSYRSGKRLKKGNHFVIEDGNVIYDPASKNNIKYLINILFIIFINTIIKLFDIYIFLILS